VARADDNRIIFFCHGFNSVLFKLVHKFVQLG
jgi:hypothetical protein